MKIKNIDEEILIIAGVIVLGILVILGIATKTFKFSDGISAISVVVAALALYYAKRIRGPEFILTEARITHRTEKTATSMVLIQNIGDKMGYIRWNTIYLKVKDQIYKIRNPPNKGLTYQANTQQEKGNLTFYVEEDADLTNGFFIAVGVYSSHKGGLHDKVWETPLTGILKPIKEEERKKEGDS